MRPAVLWLSVLALLTLVTAQVGVYLEFAMVPAPTPSTTGPQNTADLVFGLVAIGGGILGLLFTVAAGAVGVIVAGAERRNSWVGAIVLSGAVAIAALAVLAFVLLAVPRNPYDPLTPLLLVPLTTLAFYVRLRKGQTRSHSAVEPPTRR